MTKLATTKAPNYTDEQEAEMRAEYPENPNREKVDELAERYCKSPRSIIAKLSNMGIYVAPVRTTKSGTPIVKKETLVANIGVHLDAQYPSLVKANKQDLQKLLKDLDDHFGEATLEA